MDLSARLQAGREGTTDAPRNPALTCRSCHASVAFGGPPWRLLPDLRGFGRAFAWRGRGAARAGRESGRWHRQHGRKH